MDDDNRLAVIMAIIAYIREEQKSLEAKTAQDQPQIKTKEER